MPELSDEQLSAMTTNERLGAFGLLDLMDERVTARDFAGAVELLERARLDRRSAEAIVTEVFAHPELYRKYQ